MKDSRSIHLCRFHSSRYPVKPSDKAKKFDPVVHNHVVFVRKNRFFEVPLATVEGRELSAAELEVWVAYTLNLTSVELTLPPVQSDRTCHPTGRKR